VTSLTHYFSGGPALERSDVFVWFTVDCYLRFGLLALTLARPG
jgi:hypothetical protein